jgi:hypothetical protein
MPSISFLFRVHFPYSIRKTTFFDFGEFPDIVDDKKSLRKLSEFLEKELLPAVDILQDLLSASGPPFRCSMVLSGMFLDMLQQYRPSDYQAIIPILKESKVEPIISPYFHPAIPLANPGEFLEQVLLHRKRLFRITGRKSRIVCNPDLSFNEGIAGMINKTEMEGMIIQLPGTGNRHKPPGTVYNHPGYAKLKLLVVHDKSHDIINKRFFPAENTDRKFLRKILLQLNRLENNSVLIPVDLPGFDQTEGSGFRKMVLVKDLIDEAMTMGFDFIKPSAFLKGKVNLPLIFEKDPALQAVPVLGKEARRCLYSLEEKIKKAENDKLLYLWRMMHSVEHLDTLLQTRGSSHENLGDSRHELFLDFMNALSFLEIYATKTR